MSARLVRWYPAALAAIAVALWLPRLRGPLDLRYDAGVYYILGTSLAEGRGYRLLNEPGSIEAIQYPPLLPAIGALHELLLGTSDPAVVGQALRLTMFAIFVGYVLAVFWMSRRLLTPNYAFLTALFAATNAQTIFMSDMFSAELPYAFATVLFFLVVLRGSERWRGPLAGLLAVAAYALRAAGIALLLAWVGESLLRRRARETFFRGAVALLAVAAWSGYTMGVKSSGDFASPAYTYQRADYQFYNVAYAENMRYIDPFRPELGYASTSDLVERLLSNATSLPMSIGEAVSIHRGWWIAEVYKINAWVPGLEAPIWLADAALLALSVPVLVGLVLLAMRGHILLALYVAGSLALVSMTPWPGQFTRYLVPLTPFLTLALLHALQAGVERATRRSASWRLGTRSIAAGVIGLILVQQTYTIYKLFTKHHQPATYQDASGRRHEQRLFFYLHSWQRHEGAIDWLVRHARPGELVGTSTPHWVYLKTGLQSVMPPYEADPRKAQRLMESVPLTYLIVDSLEFIDVGRRYTIPAVETAPDRWKLAYRGTDGSPRIYRRLAPELPAPAKSRSASLGSK